MDSGRPCHPHIPHVHMHVYGLPRSSCATLTSLLRCPFFTYALSAACNDARPFITTFLLDRKAICVFIHEFASPVSQGHPHHIAVMGARHILPALPGLRPGIRDGYRAVRSISACVSRRYSIIPHVTQPVLP